MTPPPPQRLRILMTTDAVGGVWIYTIALARELCRHGHHVTLVTLGPKPRLDQLRSARSVRGLDLEITDLALEWIDPEGFDFRRSLDRLAAIERRVKPDVVHLNGYREACRDWGVPIFIVAHSCVRSWWRACHGDEPTEPRWTNYIANVEAGLAAADLWIAPTAAFRDTIERLYRPPTKGRVIWNGTACPVRAVRKEPFILAAGRLWDEAKNVSILARLAPAVPWPIRLAGSPESSATGARLGAPIAGLEFLGELPQHALFEVMQRASILVAPAVYEPFGLTVLEAAASGCALVLSDIPSFRELWDGAALFVEPRDEATLKATLAYLTRNEPLREELQRRAVRRARRYSVPAMADAYRDVYEELAQRHSTTTRAPRHLVEARP
jgi:glycosyltransferase involved in cell wall biosynthesis